MSHQEKLHKMHFRFKLAVLLSELQLILVTALRFVPEKGPHSQNSGAVFPVILNSKSGRK